MILTPSEKEEVPHEEWTVYGGQSRCAFCGRQLAGYAWTRKRTEVEEEGGIYPPQLHEMCFRIKYQGFDHQTLT
jgi:hypothetical protein